MAALNDLYAISISQSEHLFHYWRMNKGTSIDTSDFKNANNENSPKVQAKMTKIWIVYLKILINSL